MDIPLDFTIRSLIISPSFFTFLYLLSLKDQGVFYMEIASGFVITTWLTPFILAPI